MNLEQRRILSDVHAALAEDIGSGDASAELIDKDCVVSARIISRDSGTLAGKAWAEAAFTECDSRIKLRWSLDDGQEISAGQELVELIGPARGILSAERSALNFLQLLSAVATRTRRYVDAVAGSKARILDTRKTLPGLRLAQKYAVRCGGGHNHRIGLFDLIMLKENHIAAAGGIASAVKSARSRFPTLGVEVEVENIEQLTEALAAGTDRVMLDNFSLEQMREAVQRCEGRALLEASGSITLETASEVARTGVDEISVGELTKRIDPLDLSMRIIDQGSK